MKQDKDQLIIRFTPMAGNDGRHRITSIDNGRLYSVAVYDVPFRLELDISAWLATPRPTATYAQVPVYEKGIYEERVTLWEKGAEGNGGLTVTGFLLPERRCIYKASVKRKNAGTLVKCIIAAMITNTKLLGGTQ